MRCWIIVGCLFLAGCGSSGPTNIMESTDDAALADYEAALAEADKMAEQDTDMEE